MSPPFANVLYFSGWLVSCHLPMNSKVWVAAAGTVVLARSVTLSGIPRDTLMGYRTLKPNREYRVILE
jgi:hypothetical protein